MRTRKKIKKKKQIKMKLTKKIKKTNRWRSYKSNGIETIKILLVNLPQTIYRPRLGNRKSKGYTGLLKLSVMVWQLRFSLRTRTFWETKDEPTNLSVGTEKVMKEELGRGRWRACTKEATYIDFKFCSAKGARTSRCRSITWAMGTSFFSCLTPISWIIKTLSFTSTPRHDKSQLDEYFKDTTCLEEKVFPRLDKDK